MVLVGTKAYVSNWGGRRPQPGDLTGPAGRGTEVRVDAIRHIASEGSVTVLDLNAAAGAAGLKAEVLTGLHASALTVSPDRRYVVCANAASDHLSVIEVGTDRVVETIWVKASPADIFGASPNALCFAPDGRTLYVANGTQNAIAVIRFSPRNKSSKLSGLIRWGGSRARWSSTPAASSFAWGTSRATRWNRRRIAMPPPDPAPRASIPTTISAPCPWSRCRSAPSSRGSPRPFMTTTDATRSSSRSRNRVPASRCGRCLERIGEPSPIKHVVYVIKENRTFDQVFGAIPARTEILRSASSGSA